MDLTGLSPEQINATVGTDINQNALLINAANALADRNSAIAQTQAYTQANQPDLVGVTLDGIDYKIRRQDFPDMWKKMKDVGRDADMEIFHLQGGAKVPIRRQDVPAMFNAMTSMNKAPSEIAENRATAANQNRSASLVDPNADLVSVTLGDQSYNIRRQDLPQALNVGATLTKLPYDIAKTVQDTHAAYEGARKTGAEADRNISQNDAIAALSGVPNPQSLFGPEYLGKAIQAGGSGTISALANKADNNAGMSDNVARQYAMDIDKLNGFFLKAPKEASPAQTENYNNLAAKMGLRNIWVMDDGKAKQINLPMPVGDFQKKLAEKNTTIQDISFEANRRGMSVDEFLPYVLKAMEVK